MRECLVAATFRWMPWTILSYIVHMPSTLHAGHLLPHLFARCAHPHSHPTGPSWFFLEVYRWLSLSTPCWVGPTVPCMQMCYRPLTRAHSFRISSGRGESPLLKVQRGAVHPRTPRSSSGRGTAPSESATGATRPAQVPQLERPRRAYPPVSAPHALHGTW